MEYEVDKQLIFSYFGRTASPLQRELIAQWLRNEKNEEQYYEWLEEWENSHPQYRAQTDAAHQRYTAFLANNPQTDDVPELPEHQKKNNWARRQWLVAASLLFLLSLGALVFQQQLLYQTYDTAFGETRSLHLSDGSRVLLNANSSLKVPRWGFGDRTREVMLTGEANFSVAHTPDHKNFVVKTTKGFEVVVLGTEFTVFARKRGARVTLNKGQVRLNYKAGTTRKQVTMKPGERVTFDPQNHIALKKVGTTQRLPAWNEKRFVFEETPLQEVAYLLEENYGLQVSINDSVLANRQLMGSFRADNVDQLLQSISELLDINVVRQGRQVQLNSH
ncbi:FecR family protein [Larkinella arboricola]|uniref:FecR family protein n=1 Tax=Larkinella arboricola TaxID=643671 RepID=A0A327WZ34_LARAB|nr:FecR domain-containing protein [Larkinella arboricola]RAJ97810.1 FecR family protein [Larkinella arboricola]